MRIGISALPLPVRDSLIQSGGHHTLYAATLHGQSTSDHRLIIIGLDHRVGLALQNQHRRGGSAIYSALVDPVGRRVLSGSWWSHRLSGPWLAWCVLTDPWLDKGLISDSMRIEGRPSTATSE